KAHGVPELRTHLRGEMTLTAAADRTVLNTSQYAKRQITWARHQIIADITINSTENYAIDALLKFLDKIGPQN
ncbi:MAG TPA: hypothetical protein VJ890_21730, partial [Vineibacter sp.]|nr:hypothetical protein [Vineibacter sp.]